ncbi:hypothetical protein J4G07_20350 [Candidatus Poribacteria bacterium]|nr:hypothetical protein [Candidatus Poribacteria bacterium]
MLNTTLRLKTHTPRSLLLHTTLTLLIAILLSLTSVTLVVKDVFIDFDPENLST